MTVIIEWAIYAVGSIVLLCVLAWAALEGMGFFIRRAGMFWRTCWCVNNWNRVQEYMSEQAREDVNARAYVQADQKNIDANAPLPAYKPGTNVYQILQDGWSRNFDPQQTLDEILTQGYAGWKLEAVKLQFELLEQEMIAHNKMEDEDRTLDQGEEL